MARNPDRRQRLYLAFEGGGARGIAHVGALQALHEAEDKGRIAILGYAGTSAGALVAALAAAGWRGDELIRPDGKTLLNEIGFESGGRRLRRAVDLLGTKGWRSVRRAQWIASRRSPLAGLACEIGRRWITRGWLGGRGGADLTQFRAVVQAALRYKLPDCEADRDVTFGELAKHDRLLRIVTAELGGRRLRLYPDSDRDHGVAVADAVAASCAIPFVFQPWPIDNVNHVDGGLVSNLPAWAFDNQLRLDEDAGVVAMQIGDPPDPSVAPRSSHLADLARTAIFGSAPLHTRNIPQLFGVVLRPRLALLQFDATVADIQRDVAQAKADTERQVLRAVISNAKALQQVAEIAKTAFRRALDLERAALGHPLYRGRLRAAFADLFGDPPVGLRLRHTVGYDLAADDRLSLPIRGSATGAGYLQQAHASAFEPMENLPEDQSLSNPCFRIAKNRTRPAQLSFLVTLPLGSARLAELLTTPHLFVIDGNLASEVPRETLQAIAETARRVLLLSMEAAFAPIAAPASEDPAHD